MENFVDKVVDYIKGYSIERSIAFFSIYNFALFFKE